MRHILIHALIHILWEVEVQNFYSTTAFRILSTENQTLTHVIQTKSPPRRATSQEHNAPNCLVHSACVSQKRLWRPGSHRAWPVSSLPSTGNRQFPNLPLPANGPVCTRPCTSPSCTSPPWQNQLAKMTARWWVYQWWLKRGRTRAWGPPSSGPGRSPRGWHCRVDAWSWGPQTPQRRGWRCRIGLPSPCCGSPAWG